MVKAWKILVGLVCVEIVAEQGFLVKIGVGVKEIYINIKTKLKKFISHSNYL